MHHLLSAFFALIFSIGHAQPQHTDVNFVPAPFAAQSPVPLPPRQRLGLAGCAADYGCQSPSTPSPAAPHTRTSPTVRLAFSAPRR